MANSLLRGKKSPKPTKKDKSWIYTNKHSSIHPCNWPKLLFAILVGSSRFVAILTHGNKYLPKKDAKADGES